MGKAVELREVEIASLRPYERNAKQHGKEQVERIAKSIRELGFLSPCLIDQEFNVIAGTRSDYGGENDRHGDCAVRIR